MSNTTIDVAALNSAYVSALPKHTADATAHAAAKSEALGFAMPTSVQSVETTICAGWPVIFPFIMEAVTVFGWFQPARAGQAKAALTALNEKLFPVICPK